MSTKRINQDDNFKQQFTQVIQTVNNSKDPVTVTFNIKKSRSLVAVTINRVTEPTAEDENYYQYTADEFTFTTVIERITAEPDDQIKIMITPRMVFPSVILCITIGHIPTPAI